MGLEPSLVLSVKTPVMSSNTAVMTFPLKDMSAFEMLILVLPLNWDFEMLIHIGIAIDFLKVSTSMGN